MGYMNKEKLDFCVIRISIFCVWCSAMDNSSCVSPNLKKSWNTARNTFFKGQALCFETRKTSVSQWRHKARKHWKCHLSFPCNLTNQNRRTGFPGPCSLNHAITSFNRPVTIMSEERFSASANFLSQSGQGERLFTSVNFNMQLQMTTICLNVWLQSRDSARRSRKIARHRERPN